MRVGCAAAGHGSDKSIAKTCKVARHNSRLRFTSELFLLPATRAKRVQIVVENAIWRRPDIDFATRAARVFFNKRDFSALLPLGVEDVSLIHRAKHFVQRPLVVCFFGVRAGSNVYDVSVCWRVIRRFLLSADNSILSHNFAFRSRRTLHRFALTLSSEVGQIWG
jgi:hypothetical protein